MHFIRQRTLADYRPMARPPSAMSPSAVSSGSNCSGRMERLAMAGRLGYPTD